MAVTIYATRDQLKANLGITDDTENAALDRALEGSSRSIDDLAGRRFWTDDAVSARTFRPADRVVCEQDGYLLLVDDIATTTGLIVEVGSTSGSYTAITAYETAPENALVHGRAITGLLRAVPWHYGPYERIRVTAKWGWPTVPAQIVQACLIQAGRHYRRKDSPEGVTASSEWGPIRVTRVDPDVQALVQYFALPGFG